MSKIELLKPEINLNTVKDGRGGIFTYYPHDSIKEWNYIVTLKGATRGHHSHPEFDEYIMFVEGHGIYVEKENDLEESTVVGAGDCIFIPKGTVHTFFPLEDCKIIALLTKKWNDCEIPSRSEK